MRFDLTLASNYIFEKDLGFGRFTGHSKYAFFIFIFSNYFLLKKRNFILELVKSINFPHSFKPTPFICNR